MNQRSGTLSARLLANGAEPRIAQILTPSCGLLNSGYTDTNAPLRCRVVDGGLDVGSITGTYGTYVPENNSQATGNNFVGGGLDGIADLQLVTLNNFSSFVGNQYSGRIDYQATDKDKLAFNVNFTPLSSLTYNTAAQSRPQADLNSNRLTYLIGGIYTRTISSTILNEFRFNTTKWGFNEIDANPDSDFGIPRIEIEALFGDRLRFGAPRGETTPGFFNQRQIDIRNTLTNVVGNHTLKFGVEYRKEINTSGAPGGARPQYSFTRMWNFANGTPVYQAMNADATGTPRANDVPFNTSNIAAFIQDNWKFSPNLTVNLGLRWEYLAPISAGDDGELGRLVLGNNGLQNATIERVKQFTDKDLNNFAPQLGFSWNPEFLNKKAVIRGGFGIGYDRLASALFSNVRFAPPNAARYEICCGTASNPFNATDNARLQNGLIQFVASTDGTIYGYPQNTSLGGGFGANGGPRLGRVEIYSSPRDLPNAYVYRYSMEAQYELPAQMVATLGYQGSAGRRFVRILPLHALNSSTTSPTFRLVYFASPDVNTNYNAMLVSLKKRFSKNFDINANYRFSKSIDTVSLEAPCGCTNQTYPFDNSTERGPSDFDVRNHLVVSGTFEPDWFKGQKNIAGDLLAGWSFSPIVTWRGGFPWTPVISNGLTLSTDTTTVNPTRPRVYYGTAPLDNSNETLLSSGMFPNNLIRNSAGAVVPCNTPGTTPGGCSNYFLTTANGGNYLNNVPGIGRNVFRGPRYFSTDLSVAKSFFFPPAGFLGESARVDLRFNFFNLFNTLNLATFTPNSASTQINNPQFGYPTAALAGRVGEFQVRFSF